MRDLVRRLFILTGVAVAVVPVPAAGARTWYVRSGDGAGAGTRGAPLHTLAAVEVVSGPGDRIVVLAGASPLGGGIRLQPRQQLLGVGAPVLTNADPARLDGDVVRLADGVTVRGLRIAGARRGGIYGADVRDAAITNNDISGHNAGCARGFLIPPFAVPTTLPGIGVPISAGLQNGWAGIMVDATRGRTTVVIRANRVHDSECGDGIDVRASGTAQVRATIAHNDVRELREGSSLQSVLAIGLQTRDHARMTVRVEDNRESGLGNDEDLGAGPTGADSEGIFVNPVGPSRLRVLVRRNTYTHTAGRGGFSANGLEFVSMGAGAQGLVDVRDSAFSGPPGDVIEQLALGTDATLRMRLDHVRASGSTGFAGSGVGDTVVIPGNDADCLIAASGGARNAIDLAVRRSELRGCANNGLTFGSAVANGTGATRAMRLVVADSRITENHGGNLRIGNVTALERLSVRVERTDLSNSRGVGSAPANLFAEDLGTTGHAVIDLGGGSLGSAGGNCLQGGLLAASLVRFDASARGAWWGAPGGPGPGRALAVGGRLDAGAPLASRPPAC